MPHKRRRAGVRRTTYKDRLQKERVQVAAGAATVGRHGRDHFSAIAASKRESWAKLQNLLSEHTLHVPHGLAKLAAPASSACQPQQPKQHTVAPHP